MLIAVIQIDKIKRLVDLIDTVTYSFKEEEVKFIVFVEEVLRVDERLQNLIKIRAV